jgi:CheY-like chemotaxis protein
MHAALGLIEVARGESRDRTWESHSRGVRISSDRLLRVIDDFQELVANQPSETAEPVRFDAALRTGEIVAVLNLASTGRGARICIDAPADPVVLTQDQPAVENALTRLFDAASKLEGGGELHVAVRPQAGAVSVSLLPGSSTAAGQIMDWLAGDLEQVALADPAGVPVAVALMVAGKRIRALGGSARLEGFDESSLLIVEFPSRPATETPSALPSPDADSLSVLIAEDCDESFDLTALLLPKENVWRAHDGPEAVGLVQKQRFDVVFMDVHMPGIEGYDAIRAIRSWETETGNARTPIVILSSDTLETQRRSAAQSGCSGFLRKPLRRHDIDEVVDALRRARMIEMA